MSAPASPPGDPELFGTDGSTPGIRSPEAGGRRIDDRAERVAWSTVMVDGHRVRFGQVGSGPSALFLHGWGLRPNAYAGPIEAMAAAGCRVVAPSLPGFGGTPEMPFEERSFGGGVSTAFVHHQPERVASLLLVNAIGSPTWALLPNEVRTMVQRPFWDWGRHFGGDLLHSPRALRLLPTLLEDFVPNLVRNPLGMFRTGEVIRRADLVAEVRAIAARGIPVSVAWSDRDGLVPRSAFDELRRAAGVDGVVVEGAHAWLIADPAAFGELVISALVDGRPGAAGSDGTPIALS